MGTARSGNVRELKVMLDELPSENDVEVDEPLSPEAGRAIYEILRREREG